jgi:hypothetical protein
VSCRVACRVLISLQRVSEIEPISSIQRHEKFRANYVVEMAMAKREQARP